MGQDAKDIQTHLKNDGKTYMEASRIGGRVPLIVAGGILLAIGLVGKPVFFPEKKPIHQKKKKGHTTKEQYYEDEKL